MITPTFIPSLHLLHANQDGSCKNNSLTHCYRQIPTFHRPSFHRSPSPSSQHNHFMKISNSGHVEMENGEQPTPSPTSVPPLTTAAVDENILSPMMRHYVRTRRRLAKSLCLESDRQLILLYRVGDFFESFFEDATALSNYCGLALTSKDGGKSLGCRVPMAGLPHFCLDDKVSILLSFNITVAVVDQVSSSNSTTKSNGQNLVHRAVTRLLTPATAPQDAMSSSYVAAVCVMPTRMARSDNSDDRSTTPGEKDVAIENGLDVPFAFGFSYADACGGEFRATEDKSLSEFQTLLATRRPAELVVTSFTNTPQSNQIMKFVAQEGRRSGAVVTLRPSSGPVSSTISDAEFTLSSFHGVDSVESLGCRGQPMAVVAAAAVLSHLTNTLSVVDDGEEGKENNVGAINGRSAIHKICLNPLTTFFQRDFLQLDQAALRNLEILESARDGSRQRSLQWAVDRTKTAMGARRLRGWLLHPLTNLDDICVRHNAVTALIQDACACDTVRTQLRAMPDFERIAGRVASTRVTPRDLRWLCECILSIPFLLKRVPSQVLDSPLDDDYVIDTPTEKINGRRYVHDKQTERWNIENLLRTSEFIVDALIDPAPSTLPSTDSIADSGIRILKQGYNETLDKLRAEHEAQGHGSKDSPKSSEVAFPSWITDLEEREQARTGIDSLRVKHVRNYGYVVRVPRAVGERMLGHDELFFSKLGYERVQGTKVEMRFTFAELRARARALAIAVAEVIALERKLFLELCEMFRPFIAKVRQLGALIACIDVVSGFATVAMERGYVRPEMTREDAVVEVEDVRHAVVEQLLPVSKSFVANSLQMGRITLENHAVIPELLLLTSPNSAGKSCALRSIGLTVVLAQAGCFVPARRARLGICDRVFTRVGAVDDVANGQSTFQVEMAEAACILSHAGPQSVVLLDEIGRGTSTADGIAIAWSVAEELSQRTSSAPPLTMFVTHFHELNHLAKLYRNIKALHIAMQTSPTGDLVSTYVIKDGPSYESLGINTARRAGFPSHVLERARLIARIVSNPCQAIGHRLRLALTADEERSTDCLINADPGEQTQKQMVVEDGTESQGDYERGYAKGYQKALSKMERALYDLQANG